MTTRARILLVDDHELFREGVAKIINSQPDMEVVGQADDGLEAPTMAHELLPDLVLMDINMPDMDGYTLTAKIKGIQKFSKIPIVAVTANVMRGDREKSLEAGCDGEYGFEEEMEG